MSPLYFHSSPLPNKNLPTPLPPASFKLCLLWGSAQAPLIISKRQRTVLWVHGMPNLSCETKHSNLRLKMMRMVMLAKIYYKAQDPGAISLARSPCPRPPRSTAEGALAPGQWPPAAPRSPLPAAPALSPLYSDDRSELLKMSKISDFHACVYFVFFSGFVGLHSKLKKS